uniref:Uncharacterized protein n=1 Tax=Clastoptera arizonana TaxID=38151 RepID=A0A1B6DBL7_9HEMI
MNSDKKFMESIEARVVFSELQQIFNSCDHNGLEQVDKTILIDEIYKNICTEIPEMKSKISIKDQLYTKISQSNDSNLIKREEFEGRILEWLNEVFEINLKLDSLTGTNSLQRLKIISSTPVARVLFPNEKMENFDEVITPIFKDTRNGLNSLLDYQNKELSNERKKLEETVATLKNQILSMEKSPCTNCTVKQNKIERLEKNCNELSIEQERCFDQCENLKEEIAYLKKEINQLKGKNHVHRKNEENLQIRLNETQTVRDELQHKLNLEHKKREEMKRLFLETQTLNNIYTNNMIDMENKLSTAIDEKEELRRDLQNLQECFESERSCSQIKLFCEDDDIHTVNGVRNLFEELSDQVPKFGYVDGFSQTVPVTCNSVDIQFTPLLEEKGVQSTNSNFNKKVKCNLIDEISVGNCNKQCNSGDHLKNPERQKLNFGLLVLFFLVLPFLIAFTIFYSEDIRFETVFKVFGLKVYYLSPPPV